MAKTMTDDHKVGLKVLIKWYWDVAEPKHLLHRSDYEFLYSIWASGISVYNSEVQKRLNTIREIYMKYHEKAK